MCSLVGTLRKDRLLSHTTKDINLSFDEYHGVRMLRSSKLPGTLKGKTYSPKQGILYEELYELTSYVIIDGEAVLYPFI